MNYFVSLMLIVLAVGSFDVGDANKAEPIPATNKPVRGKKYYFEIPRGDELRQEWQIESEYPIKIYCPSFNIAKSPDCGEQMLQIYDGRDVLKPRCGNKFITYTSKSKRVEIQYLRYHSFIPKGDFKCQFMTSPKYLKKNKKNKKKC